MNYRVCFFGLASGILMYVGLNLYGFRSYDDYLDLWISDIFEPNVSMSVLVSCFGGSIYYLGFLAGKEDGIKVGKNIERNRKLKPKETR